MTQKISSVNIESATLSSFTGPTIASISIANSSYTILDDTAVSNAGGYAVITGNNFQSGAQVLFGSTSATSVTFVDSSTLRVQVPALTAGSYVTYVQNGDGSTAIRLNGITSSPIPVWSTGSTLTTQDTGASFSISLAATSDSNVSYYLANGSSLPSGTTLAANGLFSGTVTVEDETTYNFTVDAIDAENQDTSRSFSVTVTTGDIYYNLTTLHLNGEVSGNSWITDASTYNFPLTVFGDAKPAAFSPYETVWSNFFDGTGDFLSLANNAALNPGTQDFLMEAWVYFTGTTGANQGINGKGTAGTDGYSFFITNALVLSFIWNGTGGTTITAGTLALNKWNHVAVVRNSNVIRLYLNGTGAGSSTSCTTDITSTAIKYIGQARGANPMLGYMSNYRMIKGALPSGYDATSSTITVPTPPLTAVTNTTVLTCQSNRLIDNSTNNFTLTKSGDVTVTNFGPFDETDTTTGSAYFDGTGDYITVADNDALDGFADFTVEGWLYLTATPSTISSVITKGASGVFQPYYFYINSSRVLFFSSSSAGSSHDISNATTVGTIALNTWYHIAASRSGSNLRLFLNGSLITTITNSSTLVNNTRTVGIGGRGDATELFTGYISDVRLVKGTAVYTEAFTPPTSPLTAISNTSLLTLQNRMGENNNRIIDTSGINSNIVRSGNATQGTFSPFSQNGWSNYFDGTGDYLSITNNAAFKPGTGDFTIEFWGYLFNQDGGITSGGTNSLNVQIRSGAMELQLQGAAFSATHSMTGYYESWHHFAYSRTGGVTRMFINGSLVNSVSETNNYQGDGATFEIGRRSDFAQMRGYISNLRLLKGTALYTSTFTPPTSPLTAISNTSLLTCQSNRFVDNSANNFTITRTGDVSVQAFSPFKPSDSWSTNTVGGSMYFDGNADFLTLPSSSSNTVALGTSDFTWESWIYLDITTIPSFTEIYDQRPTNNGSQFNQPVIELTSTNGYAWYISAANRITSGISAVKQRSWQHLAICRSSGVTKMFLDGNQVGTNYTDTNNYAAGGTLTIARANDGVNTRYFTGYLSGLRVTRGQALYTANTTPPTTPSISTANTILLLSGTNGGIIDYTSRNNLETVGDTKLSYDVKKYGNASMYFDGTGDRLIVPSNPNYDFGTADFTIEMWINFTDVNSTWEAIISRAYGVAGGWRLYKNQSNNQLRWYHDTTSIVLTTGSTLANDTWAHIAVVRNSGTLTIYIDGTSRGSASDTNNYNPGVYALEIGDGVVTSSFPFQGYIDDLRITKGYARYTSNFTPPASAFKTK